MKNFLISYDLSMPESREDYRRLIDYIKTFPNWATPLQSVFFVKSDKGVGQIRDELRRFLDNTDKLLVIEVRNHWGTVNVNTKVTDWMKLHLP